MKFESIEKIAHEDIASFDSGVLELNRYLSLYARQNDRKGIGKTIVCFDQGIKGYVTLSNAQIEFSNLPEGDKKRLPKYPIPAVRIARLAVDKRFQHEGIGKALLAESFKRIVSVSMLFGIYAVIVDSKPNAVGFYERLGFKKLLGTSSEYFLPVETIKAALKESQKK